MKQILNIVVAVIFLFSCADLERERQLAEIKTLASRTDSLSVALKEHRIDTLASIQNTINNLELRIRNNYTADTISESLGLKMEEFRMLKKFFLVKHEEEGEEEAREKNENKSAINLNKETLGSAYVILKRGIQSEKKALNALKSDVQNGFGKRNKYDEYISFEKEKVHQLGVLLENYKTHKNSILNRFEAVQTDLNNFASGLEEKNALKGIK